MASSFLIPQGRSTANARSSLLGPLSSDRPPDFLPQSALEETPFDQSSPTQTKDNAREEDTPSNVPTKTRTPRQRLIWGRRTSSSAKDNRNTFGLSMFRRNPRKAAASENDFASVLHKPQRQQTRRVRWFSEQRPVVGKTSHQPFTPKTTGNQSEERDCAEKDQPEQQPIQHQLPRTHRLRKVPVTQVPTVDEDDASEEGGLPTFLPADLVASRTSNTPRRDILVQKLPEAPKTSCAAQADDTISELSFESVLPGPSLPAEKKRGQMLTRWFRSRSDGLGACDETNENCDDDDDQDPPSFLGM